MGITTVFTAAPDLLVQMQSQTGGGWLPVLGEDGLVGFGLFTLMSGRPKAGKSTLLTYVVREWLQTGAKVAWLTEEPRAVWKERLTSMQVPIGELYLGFPQGLSPEQIADQLRTLQPDVIVLDTIRAFCRIKDEKDASEVHRQLDPVVSVARDINAALIATHHVRKSDGEEGTEHAGSHAFVGDCDIAITFGRDPNGDKKRRRLASLSRSTVTPESLILELGDDGVYRSLGNPSALSADQVKARLKDLLTPDWQDTNSIYDQISAPKPSKEHVRQCLLALDQERVADRDKGSGPKPDKWRLRQ